MGYACRIETRRLSPNAVWGLKHAPLAGQRLKHQHAEEHAEDKHNQKNGKRDKEQYFRDALRVRRDVGETEKTGDQRYDKKYGSPLQHDFSFS
jgi:hypothetical protein